MYLDKQDSLIDDSSIVSAAKEQISSELGEEAIILNLKSGVYHGLNEVAAKIWNLIQKPKSVDDVRAILLEEYEVDFQQCDRDLKELLQELTKVGLIEINNQQA
ncbi:MAG: PqqD family protein [Mastigocoleus sp. MO_167.B18]|nr:PqqD family protein [Mastigocoleus sp. MO_167.B18]